MKKTTKRKWKRFGIFLFVLLFVILFVEAAIIFMDMQQNKNGNASPSPTSDSTPLETDKKASEKPSVTITKHSNTPGETPINTKKPTATPVYSPNDNLSNTAASWYYMPATKLFADIKSTTNSNMVGLANKYNSIWQDSTGSKVVYITMDTGENCNSNLNKIMNVAKSKNVKITFFLTGGYISSYPSMVKRMVNEGHIVANHTYNHPNLPKYLDSNGYTAFKKEITDTAAAYKNVTGNTMIKLLRPPEGAYSEKIMDITKKMGYRLAFWSFAYQDWISDNQPTHDYALNKILGQLHPGSVILLHPKSNTNTAIFSEMIDKMKSRGYSFKGLNEFPQ